MSTERQTVFIVTYGASEYEQSPLAVVQSRESAEKRCAEWNESHEHQPASYGEFEVEP